MGLGWREREGVKEGGEVEGRAGGRELRREGRWKEGKEGGS